MWQTNVIKLICNNLIKVISSISMHFFNSFCSEFFRISHLICSESVRVWKVICAQRFYLGYSEWKIRAGRATRVKLSCLATQKHELYNASVRRIRLRPFARNPIASEMFDRASCDDPAAAAAAPAPHCRNARDQSSKYRRPNLPPFGFSSPNATLDHLLREEGPRLNNRRCSPKGYLQNKH